MIQKAFRLNATNIGGKIFWEICGILFESISNFAFFVKDLKPILKLNYSADVESLNLTLNWTVKAPIGSRFKPEKMILLYSENNGTYKFVNKYSKL